MKNGLFSINLFRRYRTRIEEWNYKGVFFAGIAFMVIFALDILMKYILKPSAVRYEYIIYAVVCAAVLALLKYLYGKIRGVVTITIVLWYIIGFFGAAHGRFLYPNHSAIISFALVSFGLATAIIAEPVFMILGQLGGLALVYGAAYLSTDGAVESDTIASLVICSLSAIIVGLVLDFIRIEGLVFKGEMELFGKDEDNMFVESHSDAAWSGRNKYGILSGNITSTRRVFTFVFSVSKKRVEHVRKGNVFGISEGMSWDKAQAKIISMALERGAAMRMTNFFDRSVIERYYKAGKRRFSVIGGFCLADLEKVWLDIECVVSTHPITGEILASFVAEDVTEERMLMGVLNRIVEQNYDYDMCFECAPDTPINSTISFAVKPGEEIRGTYGPSYAEAISQYIKSQVAEGDVERALAASKIETVKAELVNNQVYSFMVDEVQPDGTILKKLFQYSYLDPAKRFMNVIKQDITEVIAKEEAQNLLLEKTIKEKDVAMSMQNDFMTRMSHEMRTPMNAILGLANLIQDEINNPKALDDYIKKIQYSGQFLLQLINDVLDMSKMEQSKFKLNYEAYSFGEFWEAIDMMITPMCQNKNLDFEWRSSLPEAMYVRTDKLRLTQVFVNLLSNAVKYTPEGGHIIFECREVDRHGKFADVEISVIDDGIGMSAVFQRHLFEPFAQESKVVNSNLNGTGLGLSIAKGIVEALGGTIDVISKVGKGSTFTVHLSFEVVKEGPKIRPIVVDEDISGRRVLVVEDNDINREIAVALLEKRKVIAETAVNGQEAVDMFANHEPGYYDLILMDIRMPVMTGLEATKAIRKLEREDATQIPIVAMTANAMDKDVKASERAGLNEHLAKPIEPKVLYDTIAKYVN